MVCKAYGHTHTPNTKNIRFCVVNRSADKATQSCKILLMLMQESTEFILPSERGHKADRFAAVPECTQTGELQPRAATPSAAAGNFRPLGGPPSPSLPGRGYTPRNPLRWAGAPQSRPGRRQREERGGAARRVTGQHGGEAAGGWAGRVVRLAAGVQQRGRCRVSAPQHRAHHALPEEPAQVPRAAAPGGPAALRAPKGRRAL